MGGAPSITMNRYRASSAMDEDEHNALSVAAVKHRDTHTHRGSFVLERVDLSGHQNVGTLRTDKVRPDVLDIPVLARFPFVDYKFVKKIGEGSFCTVYKATNVNDEKIHIAMKEIRVADMPRQRYEDFRYELNLMSQLHHPNILRVAAVYEPESAQTHTQCKLYVAAEYLRGGELLPAICARAQYHEQDIRRFMRELLSALKYLHKRGVVHGNLVPENVVISQPNFQRASIKLVDFGRAECYAARRPNVAERMRDDSEFMAPELFSRQRAINIKNLSTAADIWGFGRVLCALLTASFPVQNAHVNVEVSVYSSYCLDFIIFIGSNHFFQGPNVYFVNNRWTNVSTECKSLIDKILVKDPSRRPTARELLQHEWFQIPELFVDEPGQQLPNDLTANIPELISFNDERLLPTSFLVSSGVIKFMKVGRYRNEKKMARLSNSSTATLPSLTDEDD